jgi:succinoglycan biosynthesis protein ExoM
MPDTPAIMIGEKEQVQVGDSAMRQACISVCVCTFKRPAFLEALLNGLLEQKTDGKFTFSIIVVDNDGQESGRETVERIQQRNPGVIEYFVEREQNIALARNRTVAHATGDLIAFIDDDEIPPEEWLLTMYSALNKYGADGVLGPVGTRFVIKPPDWVIKSGIFDRPNGPGRQSGLILQWDQTGTGNVLLRRRVLEGVVGPFRQQFGSGGEDLDFFRRAIELGRVFVWCDDATVYETVPAERTRISFQLKRALLRGKASLSHQSRTGPGVLKSLVACILYSLLSPFFLIMGWHVFLKYLIRNFDHLGKLLALCGIDPVKQKYVVK